MQNGKEKGLNHQGKKEVSSYITFDIFVLAVDVAATTLSTLLSRLAWELITIHLNWLTIGSKANSLFSQNECVSIMRLCA